MSFRYLKAKWIPQREYWSEAMEKRYHHRRKEMWPKVPLKVIVMPHSHNDPGWLKTYEGYFHASTKMILDNAVDKLTKYSNMTFIWTEISFLSMWWDSAHPARKQNLKKLVTEGRFEILTGGWVMTDEANVNLYAMVDNGRDSFQLFVGVSDTCQDLYLLVLSSGAHAAANMTSLRATDGSTSCHSGESSSLHG